MTFETNFAAPALLVTAPELEFTCVCCWSILKLPEQFESATLRPSPSSLLDNSENCGLSLPRLPVEEDSTVISSSPVIPPDLVAGVVALNFWRSKISAVVKSDALTRFVFTLLSHGFEVGFFIIGGGARTSPIPGPVVTTIVAIVVMILLQVQTASVPLHIGHSWSAVGALFVVCCVTADTSKSLTFTESIIVDVDFMEDDEEEPAFPPFISDISSW